jgi:hypothetical protein
VTIVSGSRQTKKILLPIGSFEKKLCLGIYRWALACTTYKFLYCREGRYCTRHTAVVYEMCTLQDVALHIKSLKL